MKFFPTIFSILSLLPFSSTGFAALQPEQLISESLFESDFTCTESSIISESQIDKYYECKPSQLETLLRQTIEASSHEDGDTLIKFLISPHPIYFEMIKKGNGHLFLPVSQKEYKAFKVYDACDDKSLFIPGRANIQIKDLNQDGLYDFDIKFNIRLLHGKTYFAHRIFIQNLNCFFHEI